MKAKLGPIPVPLLIFAVVGVLVYLYFRRHPSSTPTSAGSNATPATTDTAGTYPAADSTGGGASGGLDLSSLFDALSGQAAALAALSGAPTVQGVPLYSAPGGLPPSPAGAVGGGNVAPNLVATSPSAPATSYDSIINTVYNPPDYGPTAGYVPAGTVIASKGGAVIKSASGAVYRSGGGTVTVQTNKGIYGKKPLQ